MTTEINYQQAEPKFPAWVNPMDWDDPTPNEIHLLADLFVQAFDGVDYTTRVAAACLSGYGHVGPTGMNNFRIDRWSQHAEIEALRLYAEYGYDCPAVVVGTWIACEHCAEAMLDAGIRRVVTHVGSWINTADRWVLGVRGGVDVLYENGVDIAVFGGTFGVPAMNDGKEWTA